jgi:hypothetical protein
MKKTLKLKRLEASPVPPMMPQGEAQPAKPKKDSSVVEKITAAAKASGMSVRKGPTTRQATITPPVMSKPGDSVVGKMVERFVGKRKPLKLQKKAGTAGLNHSGVDEGDTVSTKVQNQMKAKRARMAASDKGGDLDLTPKTPLFPAQKMPAVEKAARSIEQRTAAKLKRHSQQITRGTRAANPNPFKKKSP